MKCQWCNSENIKETIMPEGSIHYIKYSCNECNKFIGWGKKPENENIRTRTSKYDIEDVMRFHNKKKLFCFFCLRRKEQLGKRETFVIDHIDELQDGGIDEIGNLQILCSACEKQKKWLRTYLNQHLKEEGSNGNS